MNHWTNGIAKSPSEEPLSILADSVRTLPISKFSQVHLGEVGHLGTRIFGDIPAQRCRFRAHTLRKTPI